MEQRETINELQGQFASIHDIQSQLLLPNKRYTAAALRNSHLRYSNMRGSANNKCGRNSLKSIGLEYNGFDLEEIHENRSERSSYMS